MILRKIGCDKCPAVLPYTSVFSPADLRRNAQDEGWRWHKRQDLCPDCAMKVLGIIGAASRKP